MVQKTLKFIFHSIRSRKARAKSSGMKGKQHSKETIEKIKVACKKAYNDISDETKDVICSKHVFAHTVKANEKRKKTLNENAPFKDHHHSDESKELITLHTKGLHVGSNHYNWKGGISFIRGIEWENITPTVRKRDKFTCQYCGKNGHIVHHIIPYRISRNNSLDNLITLCSKCHGIVEFETNNYLDDGKDPMGIFYERWQR